MRFAIIAAAFMMVSSLAQAAAITVFSPGISNGPLKQLAADWTAQTGNTVTITGGNVGRIRTAVNTDVPADLVLAPPADLADLSAKLKPGSMRAIGRIVFGVVIKSGGPHPDISSPDKFIAMTRQAGVLAYANPAVGSLSGALVEEMLKRPEFAGVRPLPIKGMIGDAIVRGDAVFGAGAVSEEKMAQGAEIIGAVPARFGLHIDMSGAVLTIAAAPAEAQAFLDYITTPAARKIWAAGGIVQP